MMEGDKEVLDAHVDIGRKLSRTSLENPTWHTNVDKQCTTAISCNILNLILMSKTTVITY